jgi:uncharacterized membrane protein/glutaredoxin
MSRQSAWMHRFSRPLIGAFAALGIADTAYLTSVKLSGNGVTCSSEGCNAVLTSPYANVFGWPLSLFGLLAYLGIAALAIAPLVISYKTNKKLHSRIQELTWLLILVGGASMMVFSGYLMYLLAFVIKAACPYCIASALFSTAIFLLAVLGKEWEDLGAIFMPVTIASALTLLVTLGVFSSVGTALDANAPSSGEITSLSPVGDRTPGEGWVVGSKSGPSEIALAKHLKSSGAIMYGAWFCDHCHEQKQLFGREAAKNELPYVECNEQGKNAQIAVCSKEGITGYPTWGINGKKYTGVQTPEKLAELSAYGGPKDFKYSKLFRKE